MKRIIGVKFLEERALDFLDQTLQAMVKSNSKVYSYICYDDSVKVGDVCLVKVASSQELKLVLVETLEGDSNKATQYIICKVNIESYREIRKKVAQKEKLEIEARNRFESLQEEMLWRQAALEDKELSKILEKMESLDV